MASWSDFTDKDSSLQYIEQLNRISQNQVGDLTSVWYDIERYYLARRKHAELTALQTTLKNDIQELEDDLADAQNEKEKSKDKGYTSDFIRTSKNQIQLMRQAETEISNTISYLSEIPIYSIPDWFIEFLKTIISNPDSIEIKYSDEWQPVKKQIKAPRWRKR